jgi:Tol biopolymer transport system component
MTTSDDLERRLQSWMTDTAPAREPDGLVARAVDRTGSVRQRPAILVHSGLRRREFALPDLSPQARLLFLAVLLLIVMGAAVAVGARLLQPTPSPVDTRLGLAYAFGGGVYVADWDGTNPVRIVVGGSEDSCGAPYIEDGLVSPDGRHIAYRLGPVGAAGSSGCRTVVISDPDGDTVATFPGVGWSVAWSPDGTRIATWLDLYPMTTIGIYGIDGVLQAELDGSMCCGGDYDPKWSPDGTSVLVPGSLDENGAPARDGSASIEKVVWQVPVDGGTPQVLPAEDPRSNRAVAFSPDGTRAAFIEDFASLVVSAADGTQREVLIEAKAGEWFDGSWFGRGPLWSPRGDLIAYGVGHDLRVVDPGSGIATTLASARGSGVRYLQPIGFSPDGHRILFTESGAMGFESLWSVSTDGSGARKLVDGDYVEGGWLSLPAKADGQTTR